MNEELKVIISAEISKLKKNVSDAKQSIKNFTEQVEKAKAETEAHYKAIGTSIGNGLKSAATVGVAAVASIATALVGVSAATAEYRENQAKLVTAFETAGASAEVAKGTYNDLYRVMGDDGAATEAAQQLALLTNNEKALSEWTTICQGAYATFGSTLPIENLAEAANETAKVGTVTGGMADAINWAKITNENFAKTLSGNKEAQAAFNEAIKEGETREDAFNAALAACNTEAEREKLIRESLTGVYGSAAAEYEKNNAATLAQNEAQAQLTDTLAKVGEAVAPVITAFTSFANDALAKVQPYIADLSEKYAPMLQPALERVAEVTNEIFSYISANWEMLATIGGIIGGIVIAIGLYNAVAAVKAAMAAAEVTTVWALVTAYAAQAAAMVVAIAPYLLIVAAIAAVIAIIVLCVKHWDTIKAKTVETFQKMKEAVLEGVEKIKGYFDKIINFIKENWQGLLLLIVNPFAGAFKLAYDNCESFRIKVDGFIEKIKSGVKNGFNAAKNNIVNPLISAKNSAVSTFNSIRDSISEKINSAKDKVKNAIDKIKGFFNFTWSLPKIKTPKLSITWSQSPGWMAEAAKIVGLQGVPKFSVSWNALGGVFDKPTLFNYGGSLQGIGENGAEAVVPLEKNTQWLDKLATMLNDKQGKQPIILMVDKKVLAEISVEGINDITRQTGSIPLVIG